MKFVASDEAAHVAFLQQAISGAGGQPVKACQYNFPYQDVTGFTAVASVLEGVGVSAYLGGAPLISDKDILTNAGAILVAEGLHQSVLRDSVNQVASAKIVGTPLSANPIFTIASAFITSCPEDNPPLPFQAFPSLSPVGEGSPLHANGPSKFQISEPIETTQSVFMTFVSGLDIVSVACSQAENVFEAVVPSQASGQTFVLITNSEVTGTLGDNAILAGPAIVEVAPGPPSIDSIVVL